MNKVLLMILDGWGKTTIPSASAIMNAHTPYIDNLYNKYSSSELLTHGDHVGLPNNQMGNSEVGHMNLGAGRIVLQDLARINAAIKQNKLREEKELINAYEYAKKHNKKIHFVGLLSDGGVHSHINHLIELLKIAKENDLSKLYIHGFTDGRDVDPKSAPKFLEYIKPVLDETGAKISTLIGRYYAMDRDQRWDRTEKAYNLLVENKGTKTDNLIEKLKINYKNGITDEFMPPIINTENGSSVSKINKNDVVIFFNFRTDRGRQLTNSLTNKSFNYFKVIPNKYYFVTLTNYDISFKNVKVIFDKDYLKFTLGEVLSKAGKTQVRIAETEKYPHVTFFSTVEEKKNSKMKKEFYVPLRRSQHMI